MNITWIFTIISLFFCCVAAYNLRKMQKNYKAIIDTNFDEIRKGLKFELVGDCYDVAKKAASEKKIEAKDIPYSVISDAVGEALQKINISKTEGYMITSLTYNKKAYAIWRKCNLAKPVIAYSEINGMFYTLVKLFDSPNAEENLRNATELCRMLNDGIEKG